MTASSGNPAETRIAARPKRLPRARRSAILKALAISPATLSHHVKELEAARLVHVERTGKYIYRTLRTEVWPAFVASIDAIAQTR